MLTTKSQDQLAATLMVLLLSAVWIAVCSGCARQEPNVAGPTELKNTDAQPQGRGELVFNVHRAEVKKSHGVIAGISIQPDACDRPEQNKVPGHTKKVSEL